MKLYQSILFIECLLHSKPLDETIEIDKIKAMLYCVRNPKFKLILLYYLYFYYTNYENNLNLYYALLKEFYNSNQFALLERNIYYEYLTLLYYDQIEKQNHLAMLTAKDWYLDVKKIVKNNKIYAKFLSIHAYQQLIDGESQQAIILVEEAQKLIQKSPKYFTTMDKALIHSKY